MNCTKRSETMKKKYLASLVLAIALSVLSLPVSAAGITSQTTTLTTTIDSSYTMSIPMNQTISLNTITTEIGAVAVTGNLKTDEEVAVTIEKTAFTTENTGTIPYRLLSEGNAVASLTWSEAEARNDAPKSYPLTVTIDEEQWRQARAGDYTATITFTAEIQTAAAAD